MTIATDSTNITATPDSWTGDGALNRLAVLRSSPDQMTTITRHTNGRYTTLTDPTLTFTAEDLIILPTLGEYVVVETGFITHSGLWLGTKTTNSYKDHRFTFHILSNDRPMELTLDIGRLDAKDVISVPPLTITTTNVLQALQNEIVLSESLRKGIERNETNHREWLDRMAASAHDYANDNGLCSAFDDFMEQWGLPSRTHSYTVAVTITSTIFIDVEAHSEDKATQKIDYYSIKDAMNSENTTWDSEVESN